MTLSNAEFRCLREFLGLPVQWIAYELRVNEHTVRDWETNNRPVPGYASDFLSELGRDAKHIVEKLIIKLDIKVNIPVPRGHRQNREDRFPPSYYRSIASRVRESTGIRMEYVENNKCVSY